MKTHVGYVFRGREKHTRHVFLLRPGQIAVAIWRLTIATGIDPAVSAAVNPRPSTTPSPFVAQYCGETACANRGDPAGGKIGHALDFDSSRFGADLRDEVRELEPGLDARQRLEPRGAKPDETAGVLSRNRLCRYARMPLSYTALFVLQALAQGHRFGFDIMDATALPSGTIYPRSAASNPPASSRRPGKTTSRHDRRIGRGGGTTGSRRPAANSSSRRKRGTAPSPGCFRNGGAHEPPAGSRNHPPLRVPRADPPARAMDEEWLAEIEARCQAQSLGARAQSQPTALRRALGSPRDAALLRLSTWSRRRLEPGWRADLRDAWRGWRRTPLQSALMVVSLTIGSAVLFIAAAYINVMVLAELPGITDRSGLALVYQGTGPLAPLRRRARAAAP